MTASTNDLRQAIRDLATATEAYRVLRKRYDEALNAVDREADDADPVGKARRGRDFRILVAQTEDAHVAMHNEFTRVEDIANEVIGEVRLPRTHVVFYQRDGTRLTVFDRDAEKWRLILSCAAIDMEETAK